MNLRKVSMKYGSQVVFIRRDSAEIWGFRYAPTLFIGTLKVIARTGVLVRVICALITSVSSFSTT
jgi:hypothetical protein